MKTAARGLWGWALAHPILGVFLLALAVRVVVAIGIFLVHDGTMFPDDRFFFSLADDRVSGASAQWAPYQHALFNNTATFLWPLTAVFWVTGSSVLAGQLLVGVAGAGAAALTTAVGVRALRVAWAIAAGTVMAILPSVVLWSSLTLKDAFVWCVVVALALGVCELKGTRQRFAAVGAGILALLFALSHLRDQSFVIAVWALAVALLLGSGTDWPRRALFGVAVLLVFPAVLGYGLGGIPWIKDASPEVEVRRTGNAVGASTALTCDATKRGMSGKIEHLPCGLPAVVLRPYPWETDGSTSVRLARLEAVLWYPLLLLSVCGLFRGWSRRRWLGFPALYAGGIVLVYALAEGNIGTAFRHRAEAVWAVALFAALGAQTIADRRARSVDADAQEPTGTLVG